MRSLKRIGISLVLALTMVLQLGVIYGQALPSEVSGKNYKVIPVLFKGVAQETIVSDYLEWSNDKKGYAVLDVKGYAYQVGSNIKIGITIGYQTPNGYTNPPDWLDRIEEISIPSNKTFEEVIKDYYIDFKDIKIVDNGNKLWFYLKGKNGGTFDRQSAQNIKLDPTASVKEPVWPNPGSIQVTNTALPVSVGGIRQEGLWQVELKVEGKNKIMTEPTDVVLVLDRSGSMANEVGDYLCNNEEHIHTRKCYSNRQLLICGKTEHRHGNSCKRLTRVEIAKQATNNFVEQLLLENEKEHNSIKVGIVAFATNVEESRCTSLTDDKTTLLKGVATALDNPAGGTNMVQGINKAKLYLDAANSKNGIIVLISDGEPTYYHTTSGNGVLGGGSYIDTATKTKTIEAAQTAKNAGYEIYSIGAGESISTVGQQVLKICSTNGINDNGEYYYLSKDTTNALINIMENVVRSIQNAARGAKVVIPIGEKFKLWTEQENQFKYEIIPSMGDTALTDSEYDCVISQGKIEREVADGKEKLTWEIGNIGEGTPAILRYYIGMTAEAQKQISYPISDETVLSYSNIYGKPAKKVGKPGGKGDFDIPEVSMDSANIRLIYYLVNDNGKPINEEGQEVERPDLAYNLKNDYYIPEGTSSKDLDFGVYTIKYDISYEKDNNKYIFKEGIVPINITRVELNALNAQPVVYLPYEKVKLQVNWTQLGNESGAFVTRNFICPEQLSNISFTVGFIEAGNITHSNLTLVIDSDYQGGNTFKDKMRFKVGDTALVNVKEVSTLKEENGYNYRSSVTATEDELKIIINNLKVKTDQVYEVNIFFKCYLKDSYTYNQYKNDMNHLSAIHQIGLTIQDIENGINEDKKPINLRYVDIPKIN
ncbi:hypothetical protein CS063_16650 [Sporanaerobium hydrogeniformans]|uniref:Uncharacterized protein n=1 Tax=Sporanaerobium hydrogeniformans TaxID=3072179 RepID=A0AC61D6K7_9FIRM|nr:vWA domain-containing protein [Sporanaerobium hydrogeniformans]PHV69284.1 hypothetical protein CS063_16650 [Sporanaerobium hydrogeniformans]